MNPTKTFALVVITADLLALVYFGGRWITTGAPIPKHGAHEEHIVVESVKAGLPLETAEQATPEPTFDLASYVADPVKGQKVAAHVYLYVFVYLPKWIGKRNMGAI